MFEANCSRQMGQHKKRTLNLCLELGPLHVEVQKLCGQGSGETALSRTELDYFLPHLFLAVGSELNFRLKD